MSNKRLAGSGSSTIRRSFLGRWRKIRHLALAFVVLISIQCSKILPDFEIYIYVGSLLSSSAQAVHLVMAIMYLQYSL